MEIYTVKTSLNNDETTLVTLFNAEKMAMLQNPKAIVGKLKPNSDMLLPETIIYNPTFVNFFHQTILAFAEFVTPENIKDNGFLYVVDERCATPENPEQVDIIGSFEVAKGLVLTDTYVPNKLYQFISNAGVFKLPAQLEKVMLAALQ